MSYLPSKKKHYKSWSRGDKMFPTSWEFAPHWVFSPLTLLHADTNSWDRLSQGFPYMLSAIFTVILPQRNLLLQSPYANT